MYGGTSGYSVSGAARGYKPGNGRTYSVYDNRTAPGKPYNSEDTDWFSEYQRYDTSKKEKKEEKSGGFTRLEMAKILLGKFAEEGLISKSALTKQLNRLSATRDIKKVYLYLHEKWRKFDGDSAVDWDLAVCLKRLDPAGTLFESDTHEAKVTEAALAAEGAEPTVPTKPADKEVTVLGNLPEPVDPSHTFKALGARIGKYGKAGLISLEDSKLLISAVKQKSTTLEEAHIALDELAVSATEEVTSKPEIATA